REVLARLTPIDLGEAAFAPGHAARTMLGHMSCLLLRLEADRFGLMVFRSMAGTAAHELDRAMRLAAARAARD
ncbi:MAG: sarcosine oxidase subunit gamma, partial [Roseicyclus sp.]